MANPSLMTQTGASLPSIAALRKVYSITSSAVAGSVCGTVRLSALVCKVEYKRELGVLGA